MEAIEVIHRQKEGSRQTQNQSIATHKKEEIMEETK